MTRLILAASLTTAGVVVARWTFIGGCVLLAAAIGVLIVTAPHDTGRAS